MSNASDPDLDGHDLSAEEEPVRVMVGWFRAHYESPAENTPYESAEGGYLYLDASAPYDAADVLLAQFPAAFDADVERAVEILEEDAHTTEWVKVAMDSDPDADDDADPDAEFGGETD